MVRLAGAVMTGASCAYFGIRARLNLKKRKSSLADIYASLEILECEIGFGMNKLKQALENSDRNGLFKAAAENLKEFGADEAWYKAVMDTKNRLCLTDADCDAIIQLGNNIGKTDANEQLKKICYVKQLVSAQLAQAENDYSRFAKLYSSGGLLIGALVVIILL